MSRRRALMAAQETARIPAEYQEVEYIEATTNAYITSDVVISTATPTINLKYYKANQVNTEAAMFSARKSNNNAIEIGFNATANRLFAYSSSSAQIVDALVYGNINELTVKCNSASPYIQMTLTSGETTLTGDKTGANSSYLNGATINLFHVNGGAANIYARLYYVQVYDTLDNLIADFVPCYRKSDGRVGFFEMVSKKFFDSANSNNFAKGANV